MILYNEKKVAYLTFPAKADEVSKAKELGYEILDDLFTPEELKKAKTPEPVAVPTAQIAPEPVTTEAETRKPGRPPKSEGVQQ
jgi:hypothetical protein